ncbi:hypothetical protein AAG570_013788 [Ranatra chinensis]|uniref:Uncharacterized protein n=1 Tax=Ranatra chinensis TaxID=642074 RepID=A0ABD0YF46_9HEMI
MASKRLNIVRGQEAGDDGNRHVQFVILLSWYTSSTRHTTGIREKDAQAPAQIVVPITFDDVPIPPASCARYLSLYIDRRGPGHHAYSVPCPDVCPQKCDQDSSAEDGYWLKPVRTDEPRARQTMIDAFKSCMLIPCHPLVDVPSPRERYPLSWIYTEDEAAIIIQRNLRGWLVRKDPEVEEMRQFWKALRLEKEEEVGSQAGNRDNARGFVNNGQELKDFLEAEEKWLSEVEKSVFDKGIKKLAPRLKKRFEIDGNYVEK